MENEVKLPKLSISFPKNEFIIINYFGRDFTITMIYLAVAVYPAITASPAIAELADIDFFYIVNFSTIARVAIATYHPLIEEVAR